MQQPSTKIGRYKEANSNKLFVHVDSLLLSSRLMRKLTTSGKMLPVLSFKASAINEAALIYRAIYHPMRLKIIDLIHKAGTISVAKLNKKVKLDKSLLSQQLKILRDADILMTERKGKQVLYTVNHKQIEGITKASAKMIPIANSKPVPVSKSDLEAAKQIQKKGDKSLFSSTELQIIKLVCEQNTNEEIGGKLKLSKRTIEDARLRIIKKMEMKNTAGLVLYAVKNGLYQLH